MKHEQNHDRVTSSSNPAVPCTCQDVLSPSAFLMPMKNSRCSAQLYHTSTMTNPEQSAFPAAMKIRSLQLLSLISQIFVYLLPCTRWRTFLRQGLFCYLTMLLLIQYDGEFSIITPYLCIQEECVTDYLFSGLSVDSA